MYELRKKNKIFTLPKSNIGMFAFIKAKDVGKLINPNDNIGAINFLKSLGFVVEEIKQCTI